MKEKNNFVYHGSIHQGSKTIKKNKSTHGNSWVYATLSKAISTIFISNKGSDLIPKVIRWESRGINILTIF